MVKYRDRARSRVGSGPVPRRSPRTFSEISEQFTKQCILFKACEISDTMLFRKYALSFETLSL